MTPRYRTAFSVPSGFAATTPVTETKTQKFAGKVRGKVATGTRAQTKSQRTDAASGQRSSAAA